MSDAEELICEFTRVRPAPFVPEVKLALADELVPLWQATEWRAAAPQPPPFWAFAWPGSMAIARYLFDHPDVVAARRVLDYGAGSGLAAIAAARRGAAESIACDVDPVASAAAAHNARLNGVTLTIVTGDAAALGIAAEVILAGDVCYEREPAEATLAWLRAQAAAGVEVLLADPGRHYAPQDGLELLMTYDVPVLHELESRPYVSTRLSRLIAPNLRKVRAGVRTRRARSL
jgi:predicted nicotinamide N-methyase